MDGDLTVCRAPLGCTINIYNPVTTKSRQKRLSLFAEAIVELGMLALLHYRDTPSRPGTVRILVVTVRNTENVTQFQNELTHRPVNRG